MSWKRTYRLALLLLPVELRRKHGAAMEVLFARELQRARERGPWYGALAGAAGVWDAAQRAAYEQVRSQLRSKRDTVSGGRDGGPSKAWSMDVPGPQPARANFRGPHMPQYTTRQLLHRHALSFMSVFAMITVPLLAISTRGQLSRSSASGLTPGNIAEVVLFSAPFIAAMTIPMAIMIAVLRDFTRFRAEGILAAAERARGGIRRLILPVLLAAVALSAVELVLTAKLVPRSNERLVTVLTRGGPAPHGDRTMTIGQLRAAERSVSAASESDAPARVAGYEVEVQKKLALAAACVVLALAAVAIALRVPRGGMWLVFGASLAVFWMYYMLIVAGESLADRMVISPFVGMWWANAFILAGALILTAWPRRAPRAPGGGEAMVVRG